MIDWSRGVSRSLAVLLLAAAASGCKGAGGVDGSSVGVTVPTTAPQNPAFVCPSAPPASGVASLPAVPAAAMPVRTRAVRARRKNAFAPGLIAVLYDRARFVVGRDRAERTELRSGARLVREHDYPRIGLVARVLAVAPQRVVRAMRELRSQPWVKGASRVALRYASAVTKPYLSNDPYFEGFAGTSAPYYESASVPGQWDKHAIGLEYAWAYGRSNNGSGVVNAGALGSRSVGIAVIDTGVDVTHPELSGGKVIRTQCYVTDPSSGLQSGGSYATDVDGHGTDVAGIAAANVGNALGFVGTGGNVSLLAYRVFPTPDDSCLGSAPDDTCGALSVDVATAIDDAVAAGANVVNLSFGGTCPDDDIEGPAVANALAAGAIVVAAAGNGGVDGVEAPACDPGVIAAGASALADGRRNGTNHRSRGEYVANYSNYGTGAWGIVAPAGDPYCPDQAAMCNDGDNLHWIQNIWTSTPANGSYAGTCAPDYGHASGTADCRIMIAGTSMAAPTIAGAAALILSASSARYASPNAMFTLLCSTAATIDDPKEGCGRLDLYHAMALAAGDANPPSQRPERR